MQRTRMTLSLLIGLAALGGAACSSNASGGDGSPIAATMTDTSVTLDPTSATAGSITFTAKNDGTITHELYVFQTDLAPDQLPVAEGKVQEDVEGVEFVSEVEDIAPGTSKPMTVDLAVGDYVVLCNIPGHYEAGMRAPFTVT
jgi:uncharacterized cupredoxin-like copper-binding protein